MGLDGMILVFWILSFKSAFSTLHFDFHQEWFLFIWFLIIWFLFIFCHKGGVSCISEAIDISLANLDSSLCFIQLRISHFLLCIQVKYTDWQYITLRYSFLNLEPVHGYMPCSNCCFLICIQILQEAGKVVWYSHLLRNFPQFVVIPTAKGFSIINEAEVDVFLELPCFFYDPTDVGYLISDSSAFSKSSLNIWKFIVHILLKPTLENFEHYFTSTWNECNTAIVWTFLGIAFLWDWSEN